LAWRGQSAVEGLSWGAVIQDDAIPVEGFWGHLEALLGAVPVRTCVGLYMGTSYPWAVQDRVRRALSKADRQGAGWVSGVTLYWGVGVVLPVEHIEHVLSRPCSKPYDQRVGEWYRRDANLPVLYPSYSLVDHADQDTLVDHGGPRSRPRVAHRVGLGPVNSRMVEL